MVALCERGGWAFATRVLGSNKGSFLVFAAANLLIISSKKTDIF